MRSFSPKTPDEREYFAFDFVQMLPEGVTISSATWTASVLEGTDANPESMISGPAQISGSKVAQLIIGGTANTKYCLKCRAKCSDGAVLELAGSLWVRAACAQ